MKTIETITEIDAPAEVVWQIITDFERYPEWNPFITELHGPVHEGARLRAHVRPRRPQATDLRAPHHDPRTRQTPRVVWPARDPEALDKLPAS